MHDALMILIGALIAWYGIYLGRTGRGPLEGIRIANPFKRSEGNGAADKHEETIAPPRRGM